MPQVDFDLEDYEDEIKYKYCNDACCLLKNAKAPKLNQVKEYLKELYNELFIYPRQCERTLEDVYYDLERIVRK